MLTKPPKSSYIVAEALLISTATVKLSGCDCFLKSAKPRALLGEGLSKLPGLTKKVFACSTSTSKRSDNQWSDLDLDLYEDMNFMKLNGCNA